MESIIFEVITKGTLLLAGCAGFILWANAGFPTVTFTTKG